MSANSVQLTRSDQFWNRIANRYSKKPIADETAYQHKLQITREYLRPDMEVLELGCGTGGTAILHAPYVRNILATDLSDKMLDIARKQAAEVGVTNVKFQQAKVDDIAVADASFDAVLTLSLVHLLADRDAAIAKIHRLLKPGGVFVSSTTCLGDMPNPIKFILPIGAKLGVLPTVKSFTTKQLIASMTAGGFTIDHQWQAKKGTAIFIVAKKAE